MLTTITISFIIAIVCYKHTSTGICGNYGVQKKKKRQTNGNEDPRCLVNRICFRCREIKNANSNSHIAYFLLLICAQMTPGNVCKVNLHNLCK